MIVPLRIEGSTLKLAGASSPPEEVRALVAQAAERPVEFVLAPPSDIRWAIDSSYRAIGGVDRLVQAFEEVETTRQRQTDSVAAEVVDDTAPVVQVVARILTQAKRDRASDVHIEPSQDVVRVRFRIDGALKEVLVLPANMALGLVSRIKIMAGMNIVERRRPQDGQLTVDLDGVNTDVRVATAATIWGEKCVLRILDKNRSVLRLNELGMPDDTHETYLKLTRAPFGMVLCAGPTGSGKTTTLYATLTEVADPARNVMTIEDPVEYIFPSINQIQTNEQAGLTFATGLKSILRQDPDVILVGEIRDVETARIAVQSALTGHFVLSSLHATDSVSALHRFLDMGIESFLIASSVLAIVGQRLVRRICPSCKTRYTPTDEELSFYEETGGPPKQDFYHGTGCNFCGNTGYQDRIGVYELLQMTPEIKRLIVGWATQDELRRLAQKQGMRTLREEAISLVAQDVTTISEVIRSIYAL
jgi:type IV pilus assembly protein PilB